MSEPAPTIVWFREDLRLSDNPALAAAARRGGPLVCVYVRDPKPVGRRMGGAARWWLHGALAALEETLATHGGRLTILHGGEEASVVELAKACRASAVLWNRRYDEAGRRVDERVAAALAGEGIEAGSFNGHLLREPGEVTNRAGAPFSVFTAYWRAACQMNAPATPLPVPASLRFHALREDSAIRPVPLASLRLEPTAPDWAGGLRVRWRPGEAAGQACLEAFIARGIDGYAVGRDRPDRPATSLLSPYLRFGHVSARQVWHAVAAAQEAGRTKEEDALKFLAELGWREFCHDLLLHQPDMAQRNLQSRFDAMPWRDDPAALGAWQHGRTGYPIVDAGMRQLWATGFMHNRVRMIVASFLAKHLLIDWRHGEAWFWDTLVDADPANNPANWQWVAGSGADAAPYFRIFNPILQGEKFDPDGAYVKYWLPELRNVPLAFVHKPWTAPRDLLTAAGPRLGTGYPPPIIDHAAARARALQAWQSIQGGR
jgi:deoxyribodipyrimidine photo-lyase